MKKMNIFRLAIELLFPPRCPICDEIVVIGESCKCCSETLYQYEISLNDMFSSNDERALSQVDCAVACYTYKNEVRDLITRFKFKNQLHLSSFIATKMADLAAEVYHGYDIDFVTAVPSYKNHANHAQILAKEIANILSLNIDLSAIKKTKNTQKQHELDLIGRTNNLSDAFCVIDTNDVENKVILICDDIITSGNTLNECAKSFKQAGAKTILGLCFAATDSISTRHKSTN